MKKIWAVLREVRTNWLWDGSSASDPLKREYICSAISLADRHGLITPDDELAAKRFISELGVDITNSWQFSEFKVGLERQQARHAFLHFAEHVAREEGL